MNTRRSYLDTLNQGRQRRPNTSLDELNRTLERLEGQLQASQRHAAAAPESRPERHAPEPAGGQRQPTREAPRAASASLGALAREMERNRLQGDGVAAAGQFASELQGLRDELRQQMTSSLRREFETLRTEITKTYAESGHGDRELAAELERLSDAIQTLAERGEDRGVNLLRLEIEELKAAIDTLAREDTLKSVDSRWDSLGQRWQEIEERLAHPAEPVRDPAMDGLAARLEEIGEAVGRLPQSLSVRSLEDQIRALSGAVEHLAQRSEAHPQALEAVAERLDEISRAIVASSAGSKPAVEPEALERIEARIASLGRQIDELTEDGPFAEVAARLSRLSGRMDDIASHMSVPADTMEALTRQVAGIAERIEASLAANASEALWQESERRFAELTDRIERRQDEALAETRQLFAAAERRFGAERPKLSKALETRLSDLAARIEASQPAPQDDEAIARIEARLAALAERIEQSAGQTPGIDPEIVRSLEAQVASLSRHLERPGLDLPELDDIAPRLEKIERSIASNREGLLAAAREAAEAAVRATDGRPDEAGLAVLAGDLKSLEALARRSDERNGKTFEAIHDTLLKIVERLAAMEEQRREEMQRTVLPADGTPPLSQEEEAALFPDDADPDGPRQARRSPSEAAAAAALAAITAEEKSVAAEPESKRSLFGNLGRAISGRKEKAEKPLAGDVREPAELVEPDLDAPLDPKIANRPLAPGSGAPDINAIIKRVRDERGIAPGKESDAARSDFIAAARRAAQAAAAETDIMKRGSEKKKAPGGFSLGGFLRSKRKPMLMATTAVLVGLGGMQLYNAYLGDEPTAPKQEAAAPAVTPAKSAIAPELVAERKAAVAIPAPVAAPKPAAMAVAEAKTPVKAEAAVPAAKVPAEAKAAEVKPAEKASAAQAMLEPKLEAQAKPAPAAAAATTAAIPPAADKPEPAPVEAGPAALRAAADRGEPAALFEIGDRYAEGRGVTKDVAAAAQWYERAAELGLAPAQFRIGNMYEKGIGVKRDIAKAKTWYQLAATQGNASAMHNLAVLFAMGADGTTDNDSAARWFLQAAELGVTDSQFNLGILAAKGVGMPQNLEESYKWFALVAKAGDKDAAAKRDELAGALTPEQLEKARATAELWKARPLDPKANSVEIEEDWVEPQDRTASIDMTQAIRNVQAILAKNGYDAGTPDGIMGEKTKSAITAFQRANGMDATGDIDPVLIKALLEKK